MNDVSTTAADVQVHNPSVHGDICRPLHDHEGMRSVLKCSAKLVGVHLKLQKAAGVKCIFSQAQPVCHRILRQRQGNTRSSTEGPAATIVGVWVIELGIHEERICFHAFRVSRVARVASKAENSETKFKLMYNDYNVYNVLIFVYI